MSSKVRIVPSGLGFERQLTDKDVKAFQQLKIWEKVKKGELHSITKDNVSELFKLLDNDETGEISKDDLLVLRQVKGLQMNEENLLAIAADADKDSSGKISCQELYTALTQGKLAYNMIKDSLGLVQKEVDDKKLGRDQVINWLSKEYEVSSALWSLPQTLFLFALFLTMVTRHIDLTTANGVSTALTKEIEKEGPPYLMNHEWAIVHDVETLWEWMGSSFMAVHFKDDLSHWPYPGRVASYNQIIGGVKFQKTDVREPGICAQSDDLNAFYDTTHGGRCHRSSNPADSTSKSEVFLYHERNEDISQRIQNLSHSLWINQNTSFLSVSTLYYNAHLGAFTDSHLTFFFAATGVVWIKLNLETWLADPYFDWTLMIVDGLWLVILLKMFYGEAKEVFVAAKTGASAIFDYFSVWNIVDWGTIIVGGVIMYYWLVHWWQVTGELQDLIAGLPTAQLDRHVLSYQRFLTREEINKVEPFDVISDQINAVQAVSSEIAARHRYLRELIFWYSFILMMKFFKAFQANPRLDIVIRTLTKATVEIVHFALVFGIIFLCFSSAGYVLFGGRVSGFRDQNTAAFTCWTQSFDMGKMMMTSKKLAIIWSFCFKFLVLMILLNMLMAIIMENYGSAKIEKGSSGDQLTIWAQINKAIFTARETRGHESLYSLLLLLEDEDYPAHPAHWVTRGSLRRTFPKMTKHQADYIMNKTAAFIRSQQEELDITLSDSLRIISVMKVNMLRNVEDTSKMREIIEEEHDHSKQARLDAAMELEEELLNMPPAARSSVMASRASVGGGRTSMTMGAAMPMSPARGSMRMSVFGGGGSRAPGLGGSPLFAGGGAGALSSGSSDQIVAQLVMMQESFQQQLQQMQMIITTQLNTHKEYCEERDVWIDEKITGLDKRIRESVDGSDRLMNTMSTFADVPDLLTRMEKIVTWPTSPETTDARLLDKSGVTSPVGETSPVAPQARAAVESVKACHRMMLQKLDSLSEQVKRVLEQADEAAEGRKVLWKIDMGIRQLRQGVPLPQQPKSNDSSTRTSNDSTRHNSRHGAMQQSSSYCPATTPSQRRPPSTSAGDPSSAWWADSSPGGPPTERAHSLPGGGAGGSIALGARIITSPKIQAPKVSSISLDRP